MVSTSWLQLCETSAALTNNEVEDLEQKLTASSDDLVSRVRLIGHYVNNKCPGTMMSHHVLWLVENYPDVYIGSYGILDPLLMPEVYARARRAWLKAIHCDDSAIERLIGAATFTMATSTNSARDIFDDLQVSGSLAWNLRIFNLYYLSGASTANREYLAYFFAKAIPYGIAALGRLGTRHEFVATSHTDLLSRLAVSMSRAKYDHMATVVAATVINACDAMGSDQENSACLHYAHIVLGHAALRKGDVESACRSLREAGGHSVNTWLSPSSMTDLSLARELYAIRKADVISYLKAISLTSPVSGEIESMIEQLHSGEEPSSAIWARPWS